MLFKTITIYNLIDHILDRRKLKETISYICNIDTYNKIDPLTHTIKDFYINNVSQFKWRKRYLTKEMVHKFNQYIYAKFFPPYSFVGYIDLKKAKYPNLWFDKNIRSIGGTVEVFLQGFALITSSINFEDPVDINIHYLEEDPIYKKILHIHDFVNRKFAKFQNIYVGLNGIDKSIKFVKSDPYTFEINKVNMDKNFEINYINQSYYRINISNKHYQNKYKIVFGAQLAVSHFYIMYYILTHANSYFIKGRNTKHFVKKSNDSSINIDQSVEKSIKFLRNIIYLIYGSLNPLYYEIGGILPHDTAICYEEITKYLKYKPRYVQLTEKFTKYISQLNAFEKSLIFESRDEIVSEIMNNMIDEPQQEIINLKSIHFAIIQLLIIYFHALKAHDYQKLVRTFGALSKSKAWLIYNTIRKSKIKCNSIKNYEILNKYYKKDEIRNSHVFDFLCKNKFLQRVFTKQRFFAYMLNLENPIVNDLFYSFGSKVEKCPEFLRQILA